MARTLTRSAQRRRKRRFCRQSWALKHPKQQEPPPPPPAAPSGPCPAEPRTSECPVRRLGLGRGLGAVLLAVGAVCHRWRSRLAQACALLQDTLFPWRRYARELHALRLQVEGLREEMSHWGSTPQQAGEKADVCSCQRPACCPPALLPPALPAPPPPPPPPPLPPAAPPQKPLHILRKDVPPKPPQQLPVVKQEVPAAVTLRDLRAVKLRKVSLPVDAKKVVSPGRQRVPLVTVADLQKVSLRRSHSDQPLKLRISLTRSPTKSPLNLRRQLKKVDIERSPGGTPLYDKENRETGTGLTPIMTQALRRKFQIAHPRSPSPKFRAPLNKSFDDQS
ncbi:proline-rich protein 11 isoform X1 [Lepisosteus oculatus]|uniref:proline-rich protein 11 isoform X1 n=1 Tax=Lepisosteus oculatus TaxID=7918 RepID=UPI003721302A